MGFESEAEVATFIKRTEHNLQRLQENLAFLGYQFASLDGPFVFAEACDRAALANLEKLCGPLPLLYRSIFSRFRFIDFRQSQQQLLEPSDMEVAGLGLNCSLVFLPVVPAGDTTEKPMPVERVGGRYFIPTGGVASNCSAKGVWLPDSSADPILYDDGGGPVTMAGEIECAVQAGGFPLWENLTAKRLFTSPIANTPAYRKLLPILIQGLILE